MNWTDQIYVSVRHRRVSVVYHCDCHRYSAVPNFILKTEDTCSRSQDISTGDTNATFNDEIYIIVFFKKNTFAPLQKSTFLHDFCVLKICTNMKIIQEYIVSCFDIKLEKNSLYVLSYELPKFALFFNLLSNLHTSVLLTY